MIKRKAILLNTFTAIAIIAVTLPVASQSSVYVVYYATSKGKTGHMGIALDNYSVWVKDNIDGGRSVFDTTTTSELTYYDLWPDEDHFRITNTGRSIPAVYYKLPVASHEKITLNRLYYEGLPHKEYYPADGILVIRTSWVQNIWLRSFLDSLVDVKQDFNARNFNCADFVKLSLEKFLNVSLKSREFIGLGWSTTPNKLYRKLSTLSGVSVLKDPGKKSSGSFLGQRVFYRIFHKNN
ncbi:MAG: hypothetical protein IPH18_07620 [Chitinophagaceae bacterium]|nr:hypothetical protein [Chitinophagaceae bacterium]